MSKRTKKLVYLLVGIMMASSLLAYFGRPKPPKLELVSPRQEYPDYSDVYPSSGGLADRLTKSYGLAVVLVQSPYTERNVEALDAVRSWARLRFLEQPDFLRPIGPEPTIKHRHTVVGAIFYNLFAGPYYWLEECGGDFLKARIDQFHYTKQYSSFRVAYFDLFGLDNDTAALLAKYQTEKGREAIPIILWSALWAVATFGAIAALLVSKSRFDTLRRVLGYGWSLAGLSYLFLAVAENQVSALVSAIVCSMVGLFLRFPFVVTFREGTGAPDIRPAYFGSNWVAVSLLVTFSVVAIQVLTWIRTGAPDAADPVTLLMSSLSGNFLQDPARHKRVVAQVVGVLWLMFAVWTATQLKGDVKTAREAAESLASLKGPLS